MSWNTIITPMRPGVNLGPIPADFAMMGWEWQPKIDDERAVFHIPDGSLYNRHGQPFARNKAEAFVPALADLKKVFAGSEWIDLGLVGFRGTEEFKGSRGAVLVFDLPSRDGDSYESRRDLLVRRLPVLEMTRGERPKPGFVYRFQDEHQGGVLFEQTRDVPGLEGVVGRLIRAPYMQGDAPTMAKSRWKRA
jgi:ATP-dependent DNA ligase